MCCHWKLLLTQVRRPDLDTDQGHQPKTPTNDPPTTPTNDTNDIRQSIRCDAFGTCHCTQAGSTLSAALKRRSPLPTCRPLRQTSHLEQHRHVVVPAHHLAQAAPQARVLVPHPLHVVNRPCAVRDAVTILLPPPSITWWTAVSVDFLAIHVESPNQSGHR